MEVIQNLPQRYFYGDGPPAIQAATDAKGNQVQQAVTRFTIIILVVCVLVFLAFLWFYLSPLYFDKNAVTPNSSLNLRRQVDLEKQNKHEQQKNLRLWMYRGSLGRFVDTKGSHMQYATSPSGPRKNYLKPGTQERFSLFRSRRSLFFRSSVIPSVPVGRETIATPPPAYVQKSTPAPMYHSLQPVEDDDHRFHSPLHLPLSSSFVKNMNTSLTLALPRNASVTPPKPLRSYIKHQQPSPLSRVLCKRDSVSMDDTTIRHILPMERLARTNKESPLKPSQLGWRF